MGIVRDKEKSVRYRLSIRPPFPFRYIYIFTKVRATGTSSILRHVKFLAESIFKFHVKYKIELVISARCIHSFRRTDDNEA